MCSMTSQIRTTLLSNMLHKHLFEQKICITNNQFLHELMIVHLRRLKYNRLSQLARV